MEDKLGDLITALTELVEKLDDKSTGEVTSKARFNPDDMFAPTEEQVSAKENKDLAKDIAKENAKNNKEKKTSRKILKDVMLAGVTAGKVVLPVHDAVAVVQEDAEWAQNKMLEAWARHANSEGGTARARLKIDLPDGSKKDSLKEPPN